MLANEEAGLDSASLRDPRSVTGLALSATKATAQAIGHSVSMLVRHLWLTMTEMKKADKVPYHKHPALMQPVCTAVSTPCYAGQGLAGHPRCVNVGNDYGKTRLYTPIRSRSVLATTVRSENAQVFRAEVMNLLDKGAIEIVPPAQSESTSSTPKKTAACNLF